MSNLTERISRLTGMAADTKLNLGEDAARLLVEMLSLMKDMAGEIKRLNAAHSELSDFVESLDEDVAQLTSTFFGEDEDENDPLPDDDEDDELLDDDDLILYACPHCGHELQFSAADVDFDEDLLCPACSKPVFPEVDEDE